MCTRQTIEMRAQVGPFREPAPDPEVRVIALREHPAVATWDDAELDPGRPAIGRALEHAPLDVPLERDAAHDPGAQPGRPRDDAVGAVRADDEARPDSVWPGPCGHAGVAELEVARANSVAEVRSRGSGLLGEMEVETPPLRHLDEPLVAPARQLHAVPDADDHAIDDVLHDRIDRARQVPKRAPGEPSAARLVARESCLVDEENAQACPLQMDRSGRPGRSGTNDQDVEALHSTMVGRAASRGYNCAPRRGSRVAKGGGL